MSELFFGFKRRDSVTQILCFVANRSSYCSSCKHIVRCPDVCSCLTVQVIYRADSIHLDLIDLAQRHAFVDTHGAPTFSDCADSTTMRPVVFTRADSVVQLTGGVWRQSGSSKTSVQFQVTTNEQDALIMYSVGSTGTSDFFGVELVQGTAAVRLSLCVCLSVCLCLCVCVCLRVQ